MKNIVIVVALLVASVFGNDAPSDVVVLTTANFKDNLAKGDWLVEFYAPWCGHFKTFATIYEQLATALKGKTNVGKVDCTSEETLQEAFGIPGYPSIKFIKGKEVYDFNGDRTQEGFVAFIDGGYKSQTPKALPNFEVKAPVAEPENSDVVVITDANFDELASKGIWFLEFYAPWCGHCKKLAPIYEQLATSLKGSVNVGKIDCTIQTSLARRFGIRSYPTIKFLKDGEIRDYKLERTLEAMTQFSSTGYTSVVETSPMPPKPSAMEDMVEDAKAQLKKVEGFLAQKIWISMGVIFVVGVIVGAVLFGGSRSSKPAQPKTQKQE
jgi:protein disulfide-isomerase-like protein